MTSSLTHTFPSPSDAVPEADLPTLQARLSALSTSHAALSALVSSRDAELLSLTNRHEKLLQDSTSQVLALTRRSQDAERELRWATEGRKSAERREEMAKREVLALRAAEVSALWRDWTGLTRVASVGHRTHWRSIDPRPRAGGACRELQG
jgi:hypothetical protein